MKKINFSKAGSVISTLNDIAISLDETADMQSFKVNKNGTTTAVYILNGYNIIVKRDLNNYVYSINFRLKRHCTVTGRIINENIIASPVPNDRIPF